LKYIEKILDNLIKKGLLEISNMSEGSKGKEVMIDNGLYLASGFVSSSISYPED